MYVRMHTYVLTSRPSENRESRSSVERVQFRRSYSTQMTENRRPSVALAINSRRSESVARFAEKTATFNFLSLSLSSSVHTCLFALLRFYFYKYEWRNAIVRDRNDCEQRKNERNVTFFSLSSSSLFSSHFSSVLFFPSFPISPSHLHSLKFTII